MFTALHSLYLPQPEQHRAQRVCGTPVPVRGDAHTPVIFAGARGGGGSPEARTTFILGEKPRDQRL